MTDVDETGRSGVFRTDALGRVQTPPEQREAILDEFEKSALSGPKFAEVTGIKYQTFATWRQQRRKAGKKAAGTFMLAVAEMPKKKIKATGAERAPLEIKLIGGHRLEIHDPKGVALAAQLIRELAGARC